MTISRDSRKFLYYLVLLLVFFQFSSCAFKGVSRSKDIIYLGENALDSIPEQRLDIFSPKGKEVSKDVFLFIHGGNWNSGNKGLYSFLGNRMARKGQVTVILNYPLSPGATYQEMALASAAAVSWVHENIKDYGGNPDRIFVSGHSAGGHLAALISVRDDYFSDQGKINPIKGAIMIDAAGLDMYGYLQESNYAAGNTYLNTFTSDPDTWKEASPMYHLSEDMPPFLIYRGGETYSSIVKSNERFIQALTPFVSEVNYKILEGKKHVPMITQFFWTWNAIYGEILDFMEIND